LSYKLDVLKHSRTAS